MTTALDEVITIIGKATLLWNRAEYHFERIIWSYTDAADRIGELITSSMGNVSKGKLLLRLVEKIETDEKIVDRLQHLVRCYDICRENRNIMIHGIIHDDPASSETMLLKGKTFGGFSVYEDAVSQLREAAEQIASIYDFCLAMDNYVWRPYQLNRFGEALPPLPLPEKPPLPRKLDPSQPEEAQPIFPHPLEP